MSESTTPNQTRKVATSSTATSHCPAQVPTPQTSMPHPKPSQLRKRKTPNAPKTTQPRSWVWDHITKFTVKKSREVLVEGGQKKMVEVDVLKAKCKYCDQVFACDSSGGGTSTLAKHIRSVCKKYKPNMDLQQRVLGTSSDGSSMLVARGFSQDASVKVIVEFLVIDEMPFNTVEKEGFRRMMSEIQPRLHVPSRRTIVREFLQMYHDMKEGLKGQLRKHRVSLTTDTWTSVQNVNYMVLTAHFLDDEWNMHKRILNFCVIPNHQGKQIGKLIEQCLVEWKIEKLMCISVDNASANTVAIEWVVGKMKKWQKFPLILEGKYVHVRCLAHIMSLIVKDGLKRLDKCVASIRNAVKYVKSSPQRFDYFKACVEKEKLNDKSFLVLDVPTRWNSTYLMLESALKFKKVFDRMGEEDDSTYLGYFIEDEELDDDEVDPRRKIKGKVGPPGEKDWESAEVFVTFLKVFYLVTIKMSASKHPTSQTAVHDVIVVEAEIDKLFLPEHMQFGSDVDNVLRDMAVSMKKIYNKYFGSIRSLNQIFVVALILDPRFKLRHFLHLCKKKLGYDEDDIEEKSTEIMALMKELCDEYAQQAAGPQKQLKGSKQNSQSSASTCFSYEKKICRLAPTESPSILDEMMDDWEKELEDMEDVVLSHEVDRYLMDPLEKVNKIEMFDILRWWKLNGNKYPTLAQLAKDVLPIQVSTVASESAFSTGGRLIDPFRSSLTPNSVEALICLQNWIKNDYVNNINNIDYEANVEEIEFYT